MLLTLRLEFGKVNRVFFFAGFAERRCEASGAHACQDGYRFVTPMRLHLPGDRGACDHSRSG